ncbi:hypothetical protein [Treponema bryantii]|uniref:hypothetical protein n=1 Tax=Treponema bryantii TaxID=163 RepID=UPI002B303B64|nr:hypothetical protein TRBR_27010 [Treponema bryantii]
MEQNKVKKILEKYKEGLDCFQSALYFLSKKTFNRDIFVITCLYWGFNLKNDCKYLYDNLQIIESEDFDKFFKEFCGLYLEKVLIDSDLKSLKEELNKKNDCIVNIDRFYCSWNKAYQKEHLLHSFIISGFSDERNEYLCFDPFESEVKEFYLSHQNLVQGIKSICTLKGIKDFTEKNESFIPFISKGFNNSEEMINDNYARLQKEFADLCRIKEMLSENLNPELNKLTLKIKNIGNCRYSLAILLLRNYENNLSILEAVDYLYEADRKWKELNIRLMQLMLGKEIESDIFISILEELRIIELQTLKILKRESNI